MKANLRGRVIPVLIMSLAMSGCGVGQLFSPTVAPTSIATFTPTSTQTIALTSTPTETPTSVPTQIPAWISDFADPILQSINNRLPDFEDDFSPPQKGWTGYKDMWFKEGTFAIEDGVMRLNMIQGDASFENPALDQKDFVLQVDTRLAEGDSASTISVFFHNISSNYWYVIDLHGVGAWEITKMWDGQPNTIAGDSNDLIQIGRIVPVTIIAKGSQFAVYINNIPMAYYDDKDFNTSSKTLFMCTASSETVCEFDNVKFWNLKNISGLP